MFVSARRQGGSPVYCYETFNTPDLFFCDTVRLHGRTMAMRVFARHSVVLRQRATGLRRLDWLFFSGWTC